MKMAKFLLLVTMTEESGAILGGARVELLIEGEVISIMALSCSG
jgi:hypothetical protein